MFKCLSLIATGKAGRMIVCSIIGLLCSAFFFQAAAQQSNISLQGTKTVSEFLKEIEAQTNYRFVYNNDILNDTKTVSATLKNVGIDEALREILAGQNVEYVKQSNGVVVMTAGRHTPVTTPTTRNVVVTGAVKDKAGTPLANISVTIPGTTLGTITNNNGEFSIRASKADSLVFSSVNYVQQSVFVGNNTLLNIVLEAQEGSLGEVVVVGYGQQRKISLVGAQSTINVEELKQPTANISASLAGRIAGIVGVQRSGLPGQNAADIWIRGISTFGNNPKGPLVLIDGVSGRDINSLDPEDIASFSILKDATATAVYGVEGANGVILIQTKKGIPGKIALMANYTQGYTSFTKVPELADAKTYMELRNEARLASGQGIEYSPEYIERTLSGFDPNLYPNVDWMNTIFNKTSLNRRANFSARGGSENTNFYVALAYYDETSLLKTDALQRYNADARFRRYNFTSNVNMKWTNTTRFELGIQGYIANTNYPGVKPSGDNPPPPGNDVEGIFGMVMQTNPVLYPAMYPGNLVPGVNQSYDAQPNPYGLITQTGYKNTFQNQLYTNAKITQELDIITKGLSVYGLFSFDIWNSQTIERVRRRTTYTIDKGNPYKEDSTLNLVILANGSDALGYKRYNNGNRNFYVETAINYNRGFGKHQVTGLLLANAKNYIEAFANDATASLPYRSIGIAGRATYAYDNRYFLEGNFGYNGSENFAPSKRFGFFPSVGAGWVISNETFYEPLKPYLQFLKLRYSNGYVGSAAGGRRFGYITIVKDDANGYQFGIPGSFGGYSGVAISDYGVDVTWSRSHKQDLGLEFKTFNSKLSVVLDYFKEHRTGVFLQRNSLPDYMGLQNNPWGNLGVVENKGFDGTVEILPFNLGPTTWTFRGTFTYNKDKLLENDQPVQPWPYMERRNVNILSTFGYVAEGLFKDQADIDNSADQSALGRARPGDIKYKDLNSDGKIDSYDRTRIGNGDVPNLLYGFGFNVNWKGWFLSAFFQGTEGADRVISGDGIIPFSNSTGAERSNLFAIATDRWTPDNPRQDVFYPRLGYGNSVNSNNNETSTWWLKDMDFLRLKTVDFGYYFPERWLSNIHVKNMRVYLQGVNLFYWSKFKLWDPELNTSNGTRYPNIKTLSIGVQANF